MTAILIGCFCMGAAVFCLLGLFGEHNGETAATLAVAIAIFLLAAIVAFK